MSTYLCQILYQERQREKAYFSGEMKRYLKKRGGKLQNSRAHLVEEVRQKPLFHIIHEDDICLLNTDDAEWFQIWYHFRYERYVGYGVAYYNALHGFNQRQAKEREERRDAGETKEEATQRFLFSRVTMQAERERGEYVLFEVKIEELPPSGVSPESIAPGKVPFRFGGKKPKVFFCLAEEFYRCNDNGVSRRAGKGVPVIEE